MGAGAGLGPRNALAYFVEDCAQKRGSGGIEHLEISPCLWVDRSAKSLNPGFKFVTVTENRRVQGPLEGASCLSFYPRQDVSNDLACSGKINLRRCR